LTWLNDYSLTCRPILRTSLYISERSSGSLAWIRRDHVRCAGGAAIWMAPRASRRHPRELRGRSSSSCCRQRSITTGASLAVFPSRTANR